MPKLQRIASVAKSPSDGPIVGLVGVGRWGRHILRDLVSLGCQVHVVARSEQSIANAHEFGASGVVGEVAQLPAIDAAVAAPIVTRHAEVIERLAAHTDGPIFSEKPLTADVAEAEALARALPDRLFVMDKWRYHPGVLEMARMAKGGELGEIQGVATRRVSSGNPHPDINTIWTHAPHDLSIALEVLGEVPHVRSAVGELQNGQLRGITAILGERPWLTLEVSDNAPDHRREARVIGSDAAVILDGGWSEHVTVRREGQEDETVATPGELPLLAELRAFVEHVRGGTPPKSSAAEGLAIVREVQAIIDRAVGNGEVQR